MTSSCTSSSSSNIFPARCFFRWRNKWIHNVTIKNNNFFVNFRRTLTFCVEKSYDGTHLAFGGTLDRRCHFKHVSLKTGSTTVQRARFTGKGSSSDCSVATISTKISLSAYTWCIFTFRTGLVICVIVRYGGSQYHQQRRPCRVHRIVLMQHTGDTVVWRPISKHHMSLMQCFDYYKVIRYWKGIRASGV